MEGMIQTKKIFRTYSELSLLKSFEERYEYLRIGGRVGESTFGFDRYLNQQLYRSNEWKSIRNEVIIRDNGNDLGIEGLEIKKAIYVHHMNPIIVKDLLDDIDKVLDPEFLICTSFKTHEAIHFGDKTKLPEYFPLERKPGDTTLW